MYLRFHAINLGNLAKRNCEPLFLPCTPKGILELLKRSGILLFFTITYLGIELLI